MNQEKRDYKTEYYKMEKKVLKEDYKKHKKCLEWVIKFGKYKGFRYIDVIVNDFDYFQWLIDKDVLNEKVLEAFYLFKQILN